MGKKKQKSALSKQDAKAAKHALKDQKRLEVAAAPPAKPVTVAALKLVTNSTANTRLGSDQHAPGKPETVETTPVQAPEAVAAVVGPTANPNAAPNTGASTPPREPNKPNPAQAPEAAAPNFENLANNMARLMNEAGKVVGAFARNQQSAEQSQNSELTDAVKSIGSVAESWMSDPQKALIAQTTLSTGMLNLWQHTLKRMMGEESTAPMPLDPADKRFSHPEWNSNPFYDFIRQAHAVTTTWANVLVDNADNVDPHTRDKARFYVRQIGAALSPSNFVATNPELLRTTLAQDGENLVRGMHMLAEDIEAGHGSLKIRQSDPSKFEVGVNLAVTPGKVVFRNDLIELIQYSPTTPNVLKRPILIVPPWINKFYVLDLNPDKSFVRWAVAQGLTVFVISWVNPDERQALKSFESYMREGIFAALDAIKTQTDYPDATAIGYCVGGTLLSATLAYMGATNDKRISSVTLLTTQVDFSDAGDLKVFVDEDQIKATEEKMAKRGYLEGSIMANAFNMLRPNDMIWSYVVKNYLKGEPPTAFDLLYWNSDSTRMPAANHSFYLRHCYLNNDLVNGRMPMGDRMLDLKSVTIPVYNLAAKEDHIAPAPSVFRGAQYFGGEMRFVLGGSGHIAGVVNPPYKPKYQYWLGPKPAGTFEDWLPQTTEHVGSWWLDWIEWIKAQAPETTTARDPASGALKPLCDAPGTYVKVRA